MNKKGNKYRKLMEIRSRNSFRENGYNPKKCKITTLEGVFTYKDWIVLKKK
jgi:hypothetical protein